MFKWAWSGSAAPEAPRDSPKAGRAGQNLSNYANSVSARLLEPEKTVHRLTEKIYCFVYGERPALDSLCKEMTSVLETVIQQRFEHSQKLYACKPIARFCI